MKNVIKVVADAPTFDTLCNRKDEETSKTHYKFDFQFSKNPHWNGSMEALKSLLENSVWVWVGVTKNKTKIATVFWEIGTGSELLKSKAKKKFRTYDIVRLWRPCSALTLYFMFAKLIFSCVVNKAKRNRSSQILSYFHGSFFLPWEHTPLRISHSRRLCRRT